MGFQRRRQRATRRRDRLTGCVPFSLKVLPGQAGSHSVSFPTDLTDEQWALVEPLLNLAGKRGCELLAGMDDSVSAERKCHTLSS